MASLEVAFLVQIVLWDCGQLKFPFRALAVLIADGNEVDGCQLLYQLRLSRDHSPFPFEL